MDSFNIKDLNTVDQAVIEELTAAVKKNKECIANQHKKECFAFLVGHMLGVDHVGHSLHANHPAIIEKLKEVDAFVGRLLKEVEGTKSLLVVVSDHGMTESGNHGGASRIETESVFFAYSPQGFLLGGEETLPHSQQYRRVVDPSIPR